MRRLDCHDRLKKVRSDHATAQLMVNTVIELAEQNLDQLRRKNLDLIELRSVAVQLQDLYFARFFGCFESILRQYWNSGLKKKSKPSTERLIESIAVRRGVPQDTLDFVHEIRDSRNSLVHEEHLVRRRLTIEEASGPLHVFLARLPLDW